ncbi:MAG: chemotaxis protein CheA [Desulfobacterales bacterium]|nr:chemotaxis protein CheA [Desulfobacterales bacterium]
MQKKKKQIQIDDIILSFLSESREMIDELVPQIIALAESKSSETDDETINRIFRMFHSIKGASGCLQFNEIVRVTHEAETFLDLVREGKAKITQKDAELLCKTCDIINGLLDQIEHTAKDTGLESKGDDIIEKILDRIKINTIVIDKKGETLKQIEDLFIKLQNNPSDLSEISKIKSLITIFKDNCKLSGYIDLETLCIKIHTFISAIDKFDDVNIMSLLYLIDIIKQKIIKGGDCKIDNLSVLLQMLDDFTPSSKIEEPEKEEETTNSYSRPVIVQQEAIALLREEPQIDTNSNKEDSVNQSKIQLKSRGANRQDIRVDLSKLDQLINLVGELVIAESMVVKNPDLKGHEFENFERASTHLNKIVRELQDIALSIRMIPISGIFKRMIRLVYDLSAKANKKINLKLIGEDTEIDKTVIELMADPLVHLIRNAIDHGIENLEERERLGKSPISEILLEAKHESGEVWIIVKDDGRGLNRDKILDKAIERGLFKGDPSTLNDNEIYNFIFMPGFSTADKITDISGRGVGMDVVKKNIERIKGHIDIVNKPGRGATFILRIPLTLAIIDGMLTRVGKTIYTIPLLSIRESVQVKPEQITKTMDGQEVIKIRGEILPVLRLHEFHKIPSKYTNLNEGLLIIVENQNDAVCLFVDEILGDHQAVIKGLSNYLGDVAGVSGCTILGDGEVSLILDIGSIVKLKAKN